MRKKRKMRKMRKLSLLFALVITFGLLICWFNQPSRTRVIPTEEEIMSKEISAVSEEFQATISSQAVTADYENEAKKVVMEELSRTASFGETQYFVFVDRNLKNQNIMVGLWLAKDQKIVVIGWTKTSTGNPRYNSIPGYERNDFFLTPLGAFENLIERGYRAQGTVNAKSWRGLGVRGARVWDFGWQKGERVKNDRNPIKICVQMHATDPNYGELSLGEPISKGCIRLSEKMNKFLDLRGILDKGYEKYPKVSKELLKKDRKLISCPGKYLIVGELISYLKNSPCRKTRAFFAVV